jgi:hypothetical protein
MLNPSTSGNLIGTSVFGQNTLTGVITGSQAAAMQNAAYNSMMQNAHSTSNPPILGNSGASMPGSIFSNMAKNSVAAAANKRIFVGNLEVSQVANGYIVNIGTKEGYEFTTYIASTIVEVNKIIAAAMVAFQLEDK